MLYVEVACVRKALLHTIALEGKEGETLLYSTVQNQEVESILHYIYICAMVKVVAILGINSSHLL